MSMRLKPYPAYRDTDVWWLRDLPNHWSIRRAKYVFRAVDVRSQDGGQELLTVSAKNGVIPRKATNVTMFKAESYEGHKLCWPGDFVVNRLWAWMGGFGFSRQHGIVSPVYGVYRLQNDFAERWEYFHYLFRSNVYDWEFRVASKGIWTSRLQITDDGFLSMPVVLPPCKEALEIAAFLQRYDHFVYRLIRAKRRMIDLLNEQKQAIIHQAVTRGLAAAARLKPTGFAPLREIPSHWQLMRIRHLVTTIDQGVSPQAEAQPTSEGRWGVLKAGCVNGGVFRENQNKRLPPEFSVDPALAVRSGDLLVSRASGSSKLVGSVAIVGPLQSRLILSDKIFRLNPRRAEIADFLAAAMNTRYFRTQIEQAISGAEGLANNLPLSALKDFRIGVPPTDEAIAIAKHIRQRTASVDRLLQSTSREIEILREYRTRLIADVVTGKLDVREVELPDVGVEGQEDLEMDECLEDEGEEEPAEIEETEKASA